jgi:DNA-binding CsgD family transcriptional regulator
MRLAVAIMVSASRPTIMCRVQRPSSADRSFMGSPSRRSRAARIGGTPDRLGGRSVTLRADERARLAGLLDDAARGHGGALVLVGEPGIGKTWLLEEVRRLAGGFRELRTRGVESETQFDHAALLEVLTPLRSALGEVPERQRAALEGALGWGPPDLADDRFLVAAGTMSLLAAAAVPGPVLLTVDDLHWLDPASAAALLFAARRLEGDAVAIVFTTRGGSPPGTSLGRLECVPLVGLDDDDAAALLPVSVAPHVVTELVRATHGNPLGLLEIAERLTVAQRRGASPLAQPLVGGERLVTLFRPVIAALPSATRRAVVVAAASRDGASGAVADALGAESDASLADAERRGVLVREPGVIRFRHPLLRSAAWADATPAERRAAHEALGRTAADARSRLWHRADAATTPDEALAAALEASAHNDRRRLGHAAAAAALERAAQLSVEPQLAAARLAGAVEDAVLGADVDHVRALAERVTDRGRHDESHGRALAALGMLEHSSGSVPRAARWLREAAELTTGRRRVEVLAELALVCQRLGDYDGLTIAADSLARTADRDDAHQCLLDDCVGGLGALIAGRAGEARDRAERVLDRYRNDQDLQDEPRHLLLVALAAWLVDLTPDLFALFDDRIEHVRRRGALATLVPALAMSAQAQAWRVGDHARAYADAGEAVELGTELGFVVDLAPAYEVLSWERAVRGLADEARADLDRAQVLIERSGTAAVAAHFALMRAHVAMCHEEPDEVVAALEPRLAIDGGRGAMGETLGVAPLLIEAYVALGRHDDARRMTEEYAHVADARPLFQALVQRCRGLTAVDDETAVAAYSAALAHHDASHGEPFERARTELLLGERLRRSGQRRAARGHLRHACDEFAAMDFSVFVERCQVALAASGVTARARRPEADEALTPQETRIALLVAEGLTNREVGARLFLSPKTVEHHLSSIYRKRGVRSRTELARFLRPDGP